MKTESSPGSFAKIRNVCIFAISKPIFFVLRILQPGLLRSFEEVEGRIFWSDGRVARQRSAKPCTAVRIRFRPHRNRVVDYYNAVFFLVCTVFVRQLRFCGNLKSFLLVISFYIRHCVMIISNNPLVLGRIVVYFLSKVSLCSAILSNSN